MKIQVFDFYGNNVGEITDQSGNPWFVAKDVCDILGISNGRDAVTSLDPDEKNTVVINDGTPGNPEKTIINESFLYSLILRSRKPGARAFKKWVTSEILPTIRKTGAFSIKTNLPDFTDPSESARAWANQFESRERADCQAELLAIKAAIADRIANSDGLFTLTEMGKIIGTNQRKLMWWLEDEGILFRRKEGGKLIPKALFQDKGYFDVITRVTDGTNRNQTYFTGRGLAWISEKYRQSHNLLAFPLQADAVTKVAQV